MATKEGCYEENKPEEVRTAYIEILPEYESANVYIYDDPCYTSMWKKRKLGQLAQICVHEICHILTEPLNRSAWDSNAPAAWPFIHNINERLVTQIEKLAMKSIPRGHLQP